MTDIFPPAISAAECAKLKKSSVAESSHHNFDSFDGFMGNSSENGDDDDNMMSIQYRKRRRMYSICPNEDMTELLIRTCEMSVVMLMGDQSAAEDEDQSLRLSHLPFAALLWKESLVDLVFTRFTLILGKSSKRLDSVSSFSLPSLLRLINHCTSEVREGVLVGCSLALEKAISLVTVPSATHVQIDFIDLFVQSTQVNEASNEKEGAPVSGRDKYSFLMLLLRRCIGETEPPILEITLQLLCRYN